MSERETSRLSVQEREAILRFGSAPATRTPMRKRNRLEEMPELAWQSFPFLFTEGGEAEPQETDIQKSDVRGKRGTDYLEMIQQLYDVEELQGYTEEEISIVKKILLHSPGCGRNSGRKLHAQKRCITYRTGGLGQRISTNGTG